MYSIIRHITLFRYHVFRAWGRIGTIIGGHQTDPQPSKQAAIDLFLEKYEEKTGNEWGMKFVKKPGRYIMMDIDYGQKEHQKLIPSMDSSQLPLAVQSLVSLIFDVDVMKRTMLEFEVISLGIYRIMNVLNFML